MKVVSALATLVAGCALALVIAYWGWRGFGPAPVHIAARAPADPIAALVAADLFDAGQAAVASANASVQAQLPGDARLLGIIAQPAQQGYALFRLPDGPRLVAPGQEITRGVTLVLVEPFTITIRDGGGERRIALRENGTAATTSSSQPLLRTSAAPSSAPVAARGVRTATCAPPAGFGGNVVRLNAELLGGLAGEAGPWRTLLAPGSDGLVVREDGGFGALLGLKSGDRIAQANGIALRVPDDVASAVIRPLLANQGVRIIGSRSGTRQELWLANIACAGTRH